jgi:hypothetical protein
MIPNEAWKFSIHECPAKEHPKYCHVASVIRYSVFGETCPFLTAHLIGCRPTAFHRIRYCILTMYGNEHSSQFETASTASFKRADLIFRSTDGLILKSVLRVGSSVTKDSLNQRNFGAKK